MPGRHSVSLSCWGFRIPKARPPSSLPECLHVQGQHHLRAPERAPSLKWLTKAGRQQGPRQSSAASKDQICGPFPGPVTLGKVTWGLRPRRAVPKEKLRPCKNLVAVPREAEALAPSKNWLKAARERLKTDKVIKSWCHRSPMYLLGSSICADQLLTWDDTPRSGLAVQGVYRLQRSSMTFYCLPGRGPDS